MVDGLQVWASCLDAAGNAPFGLMFKWMGHKYAVTPFEHITQDGGCSYQRTETFLCRDGGLEKRLGVTETDPEQIKVLERIWAEYHQEIARNSATT